ncbi:MAG TPA: sialidase family protein [Mycobacteriales bacterium]|nr:sialidase family protein [Mycobacteriales bacterium]
MSGLLLMVGTTKGLFLFTGDDRERLTRSGPHLPGRQVYAAVYDDRGGRSRILASAASMHFGASLTTSDDLGATWHEPEVPVVAFPPGSDAALANIWALTLGGPGQDDVVWAGVEPAALFRSADAGSSFELVSGLWDHPHRPHWQPGGGGLCLHTILPHPADAQRILVAISAAGVYASDDGGGSWRASNSGIRAAFLPDPTVEFGQCVHKVARDAGDPDRLYLQHHWGIYRSDDGGAAWSPAESGVPSTFGFPIVAHPRTPGMAYTLPLHSDMVRLTPDGQLRVFRTSDAGESWVPLSEGLPQQNAHTTVLRDAFAADDLDPVGLWFGTRTGQVYGSADEGASWQLTADLLPPVTCVKTAVLA